MSWKDKFPKENIYFETNNGILYNIDAIEIMSKFPNAVFDAIITDPPYGTTNCKWDSIIPIEKMWEQLKRIRKDKTPVVLFGNEPFSSLLRISNLSEYKYDWYWNKISAGNFLNAKKQPLRNIETISIFYKKQCVYNPQITDGHPLKISSKQNRKATADKFNKREDKVYNNFNLDNIECYKSTKRYPKTLITFSTDKQKEHYHPTQKPLALMEYLIKTYTNESDLVLDFACGSSTTLLACEKLNRRWIGIELNKKYCEISAKRFKNKYIVIIPPF